MIPRTCTAIVFTIVAVVAIIIVAENFLIDLAFSRPVRLATDFSPALLDYDLDRVARTPQSVVFLGDSVVWGYRLPERDTAVAELMAEGVPAQNFAFQAGSAPNDLVLVRLLEQHRAHPSVVVIELNQKTLNAADSAYQKLHPSLETLGAPILSPADRSLLGLTSSPPSVQERLDALLDRFSVLYAMRADVRERLYGELEPAESTPNSPDAYEGTYDTAPLDRTNVGVHFLEETADALDAGKYRVIAFLTPTNHRLLHEYIDNPQYRANSAYIARIFKKHRARVLDLDSVFPSDEFLDNDHLTPNGQRRLARILASALR